MTVPTDTIRASEGAKRQACKLFLALALMKTKSSESTFSEYIGQIRESVFHELHQQIQAVKTGTAEIAYWKDRQTTSESQAMELKEKLDALEEQHAETLSTLATCQATLQQANSTTSREQLRILQPPARSQTGQYDLINILQDEQCIRDVLNKLEMKVASPEGTKSSSITTSTKSQEVKAYMSDIYTLTKKTGQSDLHQTGLDSFVVLASRGACKIIDTVTQRTSSGPGLQSSLRSPCPIDDETSLMSDRVASIRLLQRTFDPIARACAQVASSTMKITSWNTMVYHVVQIFQHLLDAIPVLKESIVQDEVLSITEGTNTARVEPDTLSDLNSDSMPTLYAEISSMLVLMISNLASIGPTVNDIPKGCLYALLLKIGHILRQCLSEQSAEVPAEDQAKRTIVAVGAQSMLWILERTLALLQQTASRQNNGEDGRTFTNLDGLRGTSHSVITLLELSQDTLLHSLFANNELFTKRILPVPQPRSVPSFPQESPPNDDATWFERAVWRLLCYNSLYLDNTD